MKKCIGVILALITLLVVIVFIITVKDTKATTMRLEKTQGTVDVTNQKGIALPVRNDIKLYSGYGIATENTSYAYINLDDTKAVKLDESSSLTVKKKGKKLNLLVESGKLFFNVKVPLKDDESMEIQTSNMITGIRGTSGFVDGDRFGLLTGAVDVTYIDPETGEKFTESLKAGEIFIVTHTKAEDGTTTVRILVRKMTPDDIPGFVAEAIAQDSELQDKITKESDLNVDEIAAIAAKKRQGEQGENGINILKDVKSPEKKEQILKNIESGNELPVFGGSDSGTPSRSNLDVTSYPPNNRNEIFYGIMFHTDGGSVVTAQEVAAGSKATKPTDPTKADYTFGGWYTTKECTTPFDFNTGITGATTLYAKWTPLPKYQVTFDTGGSSGVTSQDIIEGKKATKPTDPTKADNTFGGWYTTAECTIPFDFNTGITGATTLYAKWTPLPKYQVTFDTVGGSIVTAQEVIEGKKATKPTDPTKADNTFGGWYTTAECTIPFDFNTGITGAITLYAKWTPLPKYQVTFDTGGSSGVTSQDIIEGKKVTKPTDPTKADYTFGGWYTTAECTTPFDFNTGITGATTLYAKWTPLPRYQVTFDTVGGSIVTAQDIIEGKKVTKPTDPTKADHTFGGWYTTAECTIPFDFNTGITGATTLYAKWIPLPKYQVTFDTVGGSVVTAQEVIEGKKATKPTDPTKADHTFGGWYTTAECTIPFDFNTGITGATTLYAKWTPLPKYQVTFDTVGGSIVTAQDIIEGKKATKPTDPTKADNTFGGWYTTAECTTPFDFNTGITGATTLYAKWTPLPRYQVTFDTVGGSIVTAQDIIEGKKATKPTDPTKADHTFGGWYTTAECTTPFDFNTGITGATTLYAKWTPLPKYQVTFDTVGGSIVTAQEVIEGKKATKPTDPTKADNTFGGWYTTAECTIAFDFNTGITGATTLYAKWTPLPRYQVTFDTVGGSIVTAQDIIEGKKATKPTDPTKADNTFGGWYTTAECTIPFDFNTGITGATTLYAKWTPLPKYQVTFDTVGGSIVTAQDIIEGKKATKPTDPTKADNTFGGWYTTAECTTPFDFNTGITGATTLYAKWTPLPRYQVTFDTVGGSIVTAQDIIEGKKATKPTDPTKADHTFGGWYTTAECTTPFDFNTGITGATTLYAKWTPLPKYQVTFDTVGGSIVTAQDIIEGKKATKPTDPIKADNTFGGWYTTAECTTPFDFNTGITGATTLYAKWTPLPKYQVTFDTVGGSIVTAQEVIEGKKATKPTDPTKADNTFGGWYTTAECTIPFDFNTGITGATTLYAKWTPLPKYQVTFDTVGGSIVTAQEVIEGKKATKPTDPTKADNTFGGWYTTAECTIPFDFNTGITGATTIYAKWTPLPRYQVTFDTVGGSIVTAQDIIEGKKATKPTDPTKADNTFGGWYTTAECTIPFDFNTGITGATTLYAKWTPLPKYQVTFDTVGGSIVTAQEVIEGKKATKPTDPTKADNTFGGWYTTAECTTPFDFNTGITGATTLYAKWTPLPRYQVTFDTDGGTAVASQQVVMGEKAVAPADPTKSAYAFKGWFTSKSGTENFNFNTTPITTNITVYAQWVSIIM